MAHKFFALNLVISISACLGFSAMAQSQSQFSAVVEQTDATSLKVTVSLKGGQESCGVEVDFGDQTLRKNRLETGQPWVVEHRLASERDTLVKVSGAFAARGLRSVNACAGEAVTKAISPGAFKVAAQAPAPVPMPVLEPVAAPTSLSVPIAAPAPAPAPAAALPTAPAYPQRSLLLQAQALSPLPAIFLPATLKNGCVVAMPFGEAVKSLTLSRQDLSPNTCPASRRYTGFVSLGVGWTFAPPDRAEETFRGVRHGYVVDGYFVGVRLSQNPQGPFLISWQDAVGKGVLKRFERSSASSAPAYSLEAMRQAVNEGLKESVRPDERDVFAPLTAIVRQFDADAVSELRLYTSVEPHTREFMNPNWVKPKDDPKVFGRGMSDPQEVARRKVEQQQLEQAQQQQLQRQEQEAQRKAQELRVQKDAKDNKDMQDLLKAMQDLANTLKRK